MSQIGGDSAVTAGKMADMLIEDINKRGKINKDGQIELQGINDSIVITKPDEIKSILQGITSKEGICRYYYKILETFKKYVDLDEKYYPLIPVWIIGTYLHKQFPAYPYLYFNAMKGSGKSRTLKIISHLSKNGKVAGSMTEAVLFRTASQRTLCIDEFENINAKGSENLKLLLNSAYKKGTTIERMTKKKTADGESQVVEEFEVYCPIALANIWGMENVLGDRCIPIILEKSNKTTITKLIENFEYEPEFKLIKNSLLELTAKLKDNTNLFGQIFLDWNIYQQNVVNEVSNVNKVNNVNDVNKTNDIYNIYDIYDKKTLFSKIDKTNISGRDLELFLPIFIIGSLIGDEILSKLLILSKDIVRTKKESDREENKDVKLIEFLAQADKIGEYNSFIDVSKIVKDFVEFTGDDEKFNSARSISRALKRLNLILDKKNNGKKRQVKLNIPKAQEKLLLFKEPFEDNISLDGIEEVLE